MPQVLVNTLHNKGAFDVVLIDGDAQMGFRTDGSPPKQQVNNLAERFSVGGSPAFANDAFDQIVIFSMDQGGDKELYEDGDKRYNYSDGGVALQVPNRATLSSRWTSEDAAITATAPQIVELPVGNGFIAVANGTALRLFNCNTLAWSSGGAFASNAIYLFSNDLYIFIANGAGDKAWRWDGAAFTQPGGASTYNANGFGWYQSKLYYFYGSSLFQATNNDGSAWGAAIPVGYGNTNITDLQEALGYLMIAKPEGVFLYDGTNVFRVVNAENVRSVNNFLGMAEFQGALYLPWLNALHKAAGATTRGFSSFSAPLEPRMDGDTNKERYGHGTVKKCVAGPHLLYVAFDAGENTYPEVLSYNGIGWHQIYRGAAAATMRAMGYSRQMGWLLINDGATRKKRLINTGSAEYPADFNTSGYFTTPKFDGGYPDESKLWRSVAFKTEDCTATETVTVSYSIDGAAYVALDPVSSNTISELVFGGSQGQVEGKTISLKFALASSGVNATPKIVFPIIIRGMPSPKANDALAMTLLLDEKKELWNGYGKVEDIYTINEMNEFLSDARASTNTIGFLDEFGHYYSVKITDMGITPERDESREKGEANLRLLNMFPGKRRQLDLTTSITLSITTTLITEARDEYGTAEYGHGEYSAA